MFVSIYVCTHQYDIKRSPGVHHNSDKKSEFANTANFALKFSVPKLSGRTIPECWTSVELITSRLTSCKIRIDFKKCLHLHPLGIWKK